MRSASPRQRRYVGVQHPSEWRNYSMRRRPPGLLRLLRDAALAGGGGGGGGGGSGHANALEYGAAGGGAALVAMLVVLGLLVRRRSDIRKRRRGMEAIQREPIADFGVFVLAGEGDSDGDAECRGAAPTMTYNPLAQRLSQALVDGGSQEGSSAGGMWAPDPWRAGAAEETTANPLVAAGELGALFPEGGYPDDASDCDSGSIFEA